jgi:hypothetical protein
MERVEFVGTFQMVAVDEQLNIVPQAKLGDPGSPTRLSLGTDSSQDHAKTSGACQVFWLPTELAI